MKTEKEGRRSRIKLGLALCAVLAMGTALLLAGEVPSFGGALARLRYALKNSEQQAMLSGYPRPGWANPYAPLLAILHKDGPQLPRLWRARALSQYAAYLALLYPADGHPHRPQRHRREAEALLQRALAVDPEYASGWAELAFLHHPEELAGKRATFDHYLAKALRADPLNPYANALRAMDIFTVRGGHPPFGGSFDGNVGIRSKKWVKIFCYRALVSLRFFSEQSPLGFARFKGSMATVGGYSWLQTDFFRTALKYYEPKELALLDAGVWKPGPCPDPWPPAATKNAAHASQAAATQATKPGAAGNEK